MCGVRSLSGKRSGFWVLPVAFMLAVTLVPLPAFAQDVDMSDDDLIDDDSTTSITITDSSQDNDQVCAPIVAQYNNITQGGANVLAGGDAVANVANNAEVSNNVVINCINGDGNGGGESASTASAASQYESPEVNTSKGSEETSEPEAAAASRTTTPLDELCPAGTTLTSDGFDQDDEDGVTFTSDENGFLVTLNSVSGALGDGDAASAGLTLEYGDEDDQTVTLSGNGSQQQVDESGTFTLKESEDVGEDVTYEVTVSYCVDDEDEEETSVSRQGSVMDGTYDKTATLANTGGETSGVFSGGGTSAVAIPAGALLLVVCATLGVVLHGQYRRG